MKRSKRAKPPKHKNGVDFISTMPDVVLLLILQALPTTEEVVRTSILSSRWRYLWTSILSIDLDVSRGPKNPTKLQKKRFKEFVSRVLESQTLDLVSCSLRCLNYYMPVTIWRWANTALTRKVKRLDLMFFTSRENHVNKWPHSLITCNSLESLRLDMYPHSSLVFPDGVSFPALRFLELNNIIVKLDMGERFPKICPLLEELFLINCFITYHKWGDFLCISCPKLKTLRILQLNNDFYGPGIADLGLKVSCQDLELLECIGTEVPDHFILENVNSLKKAVILPPCKFWKEASKLADTISKMLVGISHVESLSLNRFIIWFMDAARGLIRDFPASFPNLKKLEITTTICPISLNVIIRIIRRSPIFESLHLIIQEESYGPEYWALEKAETREILTRHLKRVEFFEFNRSENKLLKARMLLEYANVLEEMVFSWRNEVMYHEMSTETMNLVSKFYKASSTVKLISLLKC